MAFSGFASRRRIPRSRPNGSGMDRFSNWVRRTRLTNDRPHILASIALEASGISIIPVAAVAKGSSIFRTTGASTWRRATITLDGQAEQLTQFHRGNFALSCNAFAQWSLDRLRVKAPRCAESVCDAAVRSRRARPDRRALRPRRAAMHAYWQPGTIKK